MKRDETYLGWLNRRSQQAQARLNALKEIQPLETPLLALLRKQVKPKHG